MGSRMTISRLFFLMPFGKMYSICPQVEVPIIRIFVTTEAFDEVGNFCNVTQKALDGCLFT